MDLLILAMAPMPMIPFKARFVWLAPLMLSEIEVVLLCMRQQPANNRHGSARSLLRDRRKCVVSQEICPVAQQFILIQAGLSKKDGGADFLVRT